MVVALSHLCGQVIAEFEVRADTADVVEFLQGVQQLQTLLGALFLARSHQGERVPAVGPFRDPPALIAQSFLQGFECFEGTMHQGLLGASELVTIGLQYEQAARPPL